MCISSILFIIFSVSNIRDSVGEDNNLWIFTGGLITGEYSQS